MGRSWRQPDPKNFAIDSEVAMMSTKDFEALSEYSTTKPSGVYPGKCWKMNHHGTWYLRWFGADDGDPRGLPTPCVKIILID